MASACWRENPAGVVGGSEGAAAPALCHRTVSWAALGGPSKAKPPSKAIPDGSVLLCGLCLWHPEQHLKWEGAGMNQQLLLLCEEVVLMHLSLVSVKVIKVNNLALTQCPCSACVVPWITLPKADSW